MRREGLLVLSAPRAGHGSFLRQFLPSIHTLSLKHNSATTISRKENACATALSTKKEAQEAQEYFFLYARRLSNRG